MAGMIEVGRFSKVATDATMAYEINRPSRSQAAVDARVQDVAADIIASDGTIITAAKNAVNGAVDDVGLLRRAELGAVRTIQADHPVYSEARLSHDFRVVGGVLRTGGVVEGPAGKIAHAVPSGTGVVELTRDYRTALPGGGQNGMLPPGIASALSDQVSGAASMQAITCWGDSMTMDFGSIGTAFGVELGLYLGIPSYVRGYSGETQQQIAWRAGAYEARVTVPGGMIPAAGAVPATVTPPTGWFRGRAFDSMVATITGVLVPVRIIQSEAADPATPPTWTIEQIGGTGAVRVLPGTRVIPQTGRERAVITQPCTIWVGRNDPNPDRLEEALRAMLSQQRDPQQRRIVLPVFNRTTEPAGSAGYVEVMAANERIKAVAGDDFYDLRAAVIAHGLEIAGITPTAADLTVISEDRIPESLMHDATHLNAAGRRAAAMLVAIELKARNW